MKPNSSQMHAASRNRVSKGFSLIELMVAITLGLLLTAGLVQLFSSTKVTFNSNDALARVQENGRFALERLKRELREAGTLGFCAGQIPITSHLNTGCSGGIDDFFNPDFAVVGWEYGGTGLAESFTLPASLDPATASASDWDSEANSADLPTQLGGLVVPGSDVLVVRNLAVVDTFTADPLNLHDPDEDISLTDDSEIETNTVVLITDCSSADLFQNTAGPTEKLLSSSGGSCASPGPGNSGIDWSTTYNDSMQTFTLQQVAYYIGVNGAGETGLYRWNMSEGTANAVAEEIIEGAENFQVLYGFSRAAPDGDGQHVNNWITADEIPAGGWPQVIALRIGLSVRSAERGDLDNTAITLDLASTDVTVPGDGRIRQAFSAAVALRNRVLVQ